MDRVTQTQHAPGTIAVDLTPVLPGGANGGAKLFVLELIRQLAVLAPQTRFVLLTQEASHAELASLDAPNVERRLVLAQAPARPSGQRLRHTLTRLLPLLPGRVRQGLGRVAHGLYVSLKRRRSAGALEGLGADLLFCPFTAPTFHEPGTPTVCILYDLQYRAYPQFFTPQDVLHRERTFQEACRRASALGAISEFSRQDAIAQGELDPARVRTIHLRMARRITPRSPDEGAVLARLDLQAGRYLVYPANFWKHKNHEMLITAFGMACREGLPEDIRLVCTGAPGERRDWLMQACSAMGLGDRVLFPGFLPDDQLGALMAQCAGVIFPSLYEGFGLPVLEAMAAGVPVACSNTTSLPEVARNAALMFDPRVPTQIREALIRLVEDQPLRAALVKAGRARVEAFSDSTRMAEEYWDLFLHAMGCRKQALELSGAQPDGWAGGSLAVQIPPGEAQRRLALRFKAPEWIPAARLEIQARHRGRRCGPLLRLARGAEESLALDIGPEGGRYEIHLAPTFVPARCGMGEDRRELSALLRECRVVQADGRIETLLPEQAIA